jgi:hypothetical protein
MMRQLSAAVVGTWLGCALSVHGQETLPNPGGPAPNRQVRAVGTSMPAPPLPAPGMAPNPYLEQAIARKLRESGQLSKYRINVHAHDGVVDLEGEVADENQREVVLRLMRTVPGIVVLRDWMQAREEGSAPGSPIAAAMSVVPAQALPQQNPFVLPQPQPLNPPPGQFGPVPPARIDGQLQEPQPIFQAPLGPNPTIQAPPMPPYAWPTVAPYNNYSRVAYPNAYPYEQWPFIGPMYPFPRVPLGWRSVSLTWEDGHWWYHRDPTGHDWWRVRYH